MAKRDSWIGRRVNGYEVHELLGSGGMGRVYRAEHLALRRTVAIKVLHTELAERAQLQERFDREARAASRLNHPNVVSIFDVGAAPEDGARYLVMEYVPGPTLADEVRREGRLPLARAGTIILAILDALDHAHALGVIHRDLKSENVILSRRHDGRETVKVVDFGLAKLLDRDEDDNRRLTDPGRVAGTPEFAAPEQLQGQRVDARSDLYSVGVMLFEALTGQVPYSGRTLAAVLTRQIMHPPPDPRDVEPRAEIPASVSRICQRALAREPDARWPSAAAMSEALRQALRPSRRTRAEDSRPTAVRVSLTPTQPEARIDASVDLVWELFPAVDRGVRFLGVVGPAGSGKSRILSDLVERAAAAGAPVIRIAPHPSRAPVAWHGARAAVEQARAAVAIGDRDPLVAAGLAELESPAGLLGLDGAPLASAVGAALAAALGAVASRSPTGRCVLLVDDAHACDELTLAALAALRGTFGSTPALVVIAARDLAIVEPFGELGLLHVAPPPPGKAPRPAEVVEQALAALPLRARRLLQAACTLGVEAPADAVGALLGEDDPVARATLINSRLAAEGPDGTLIITSFVRDVVRAAMPAEVRRELHRAAVEVCVERQAPLETIADHAAGGGDGVSALIWLERAADTALVLGAPRSAVTWLRRGVELARGELATRPDEISTSAMLVFSRKLGTALLRCGRATEADGVLADAAALATDDGLARAELLAVHGRALAARGRRREARRVLDRALFLLGVQGASPVRIAETWLRIAETRRDALDHHGEAEALEEAAVLARDGHIPPVLGARIHWELGRARARIDSGPDARRAFIRASTEAAAAGAGAILGMALGGAAEIDARAGDLVRAQRLFAEAYQRALRAGDAESARRWARSDPERISLAWRARTRRSLVLLDDPDDAARIAAVLGTVALEVVTPRSPRELLARLEAGIDMPAARVQLVVLGATAADGRDIDLLGRVVDVAAGAPIAFAPRRIDAATRSAADRLGATWVLDRAHLLEDVAEIARSIAVTAASSEPVSGSTTPRPGSPLPELPPHPRPGNPGPRSRS